MDKIVTSKAAQRVDGATYPVEYTYNGLGKQATMTTFKNANTPQVTSWTYNARGEMVQKIYADGNKVNYTYNADGQLLTRTWARGIITTYSYDNAGRATGYSYSDGVTPAVAITLDFLDRQSSITDAAGMRNFSYNANNQLGNETNPSIMNGMIAYTYDNAGRRTSMNLSNGTDSFAQANYTYDTRGRIATVGNNTDTLTYTYVPGTNMIGSAAWQNASINTVNTYDQYKRLTNIAVNGENVYGYTLNDKNQRTSATLPDGNKWNYTYDVMGQLTGAVKQDTANNSLANMNYFYDLIGNRTSATENSATTTYASNLVNQYTAVNAVVPVYDLDGNMTSYNGWSYTYNGENRLIVAENAAAGVRVEADYDYMGRRLFKKVYSNDTLTKHSVYVYDGFKQIAEFDALNNNSLKASYLWQPVGLDVVLLINSEYLIADGNKNIIQVRNATGSVTDSYVYDPFGKVTHNGSSENPFQFSSEFFDSETGLVYYNYRHYMPNLGRWIHRDSLDEYGGINLYQISNNNIIMAWDNLGLWGRSYWGWTSTHEEITTTAFAALVFIRGVNDVIIIEAIKPSLISIVVENNLKTDEGEYYDKMEYHFNRDTDTTPQVARKNYIETKKKERNAIKNYINQASKIKKWQKRESPCLDALVNLGRLTHMLQDYYAHGVQRDDDTKTIVGTLQGDPDNPVLIPVSYGALGFTGGHGGFWRFINPFSRIEPGDRASDQNVRKTGAVNYTKQELLTQLNLWLEPCHCIYDKRMK